MAKKKAKKKTIKSLISDEDLISELDRNDSHKRKVEILLMAILEELRKT